MNMSYCRFENTLGDLLDCAEHMDDEDLSADEKRARARLINLCADIAQECEEEDDYDSGEDPDALNKADIEEGRNTRAPTWPVIS